MCWGYGGGRVCILFVNVSYMSHSVSMRTLPMARPCSVRGTNEIFRLSTTGRVIAPHCLCCACAVSRIRPACNFKRMSPLYNICTSFQLRGYYAWCRLGPWQGDWWCVCYWYRKMAWVVWRTNFRIYSLVVGVDW